VDTRSHAHLHAGGIPDIAQRIMSVSGNVHGTMGSVTAAKRFPHPSSRSFMSGSITKGANSFMHPQKSAGGWNTGGV